MIDVFKCLKLDASLLLGQGWQSDSLKHKKEKALGWQGDFEYAAEILILPPSSWKIIVILPELL